VAVGVGLSKRDIPAAVTLQFAPLAAACSKQIRLQHSKIHNMQVMRLANKYPFCLLRIFTFPTTTVKKKLFKVLIAILIGTTLEQNRCHEAPELQTHLQLTDDSGFESLKCN
jgi:hypothetical protein